MNRRSEVAGLDVGPELCRDRPFRVGKRIRVAGETTFSRESFDGVRMHLRQRHVKVLKNVKLLGFAVSAD
jgi:hypothetical protein